MGVDWDALADKALNAAIDIIERKVEGAYPAGVTITPTGATVWSSLPWLPVIVIGAIFIGLFFLIKGR
jgi:hypothetical protein